MIVIYMIKNCVNGKVYIGSTGDVNHRFNKHEYDLNNSIHHNDHLQRAWNKYGSDSFEFKTLMVCPDKERNHCEQMFIDLYDSQNRDFGYNIRDANSQFHTEETKQKISESLKGREISKDARKNLSKSLIGNKNAVKDYCTIVKYGVRNGTQKYGFYHNGTYKKQSIDLFKLIDWGLKEYPDEDLEISMEVLDNALLS